MVKGELSLSLYQDQDDAFFHSDPQSENPTLATGWLFFSIALGSLFTFTFFAALSTSFLCCDKTRSKKKPEKLNESFFNEGHSEQTLLFPDVPSTVYPTTHSILQQEQNEVVESLSAAYRELPSCHLSFPNNFECTISVDQTISKRSTHAHLSTCPNSNHSCSNYGTTSSSEQLASTTIDLNPSASSPKRYLRSQSAPGELDNDSISIRARPSQNPDACVTSSTSGILTGENLTTQMFDERTTLSENTSRQEEIISCQRNNQSDVPERLTDELQKKEQVWSKCDKGCSTKPCARLHDHVSEKRCQSMNGWVLEKETRRKLHPQVRSFSEGWLPNSRNGYQETDFLETKNGRREVKTLDDSRGVCKDKGTNVEAELKNNATVRQNSARGASSFGGDCSSTGTSQVNYYTLTFPREESTLLEDVENQILRGASSFALRSSSSRRGRGSLIAESHESPRGASSLGIISDAPRPQFGSPCVKKKEAMTEQTRCETYSLRKLNSTMDSTRPDSQKPHRLSKLIINANYVPRDNAEPIREAQPIQHSLLNANGQSVGSTKNLTGELEVEDKFFGKCYDNDTLGESISLSFAYESASEDDTRGLH